MFNDQPEKPSHLNTTATTATTATTTTTTTTTKNTLEIKRPCKTPIDFEVQKQPQEQTSETQQKSESSSSSQTPPENLFDKPTFCFYWSFFFIATSTKP